jgi:RimJ/RimL family protein N-acetyltransferase
VIATERLDLVPATPDLLRVALGPAPALAAALRARVPASWPPLYLDAAAIEFTRAKLAEGPAHHGWWMYFILCREPEGGRTLVGTGGYAGPPARDGSVEIGYGIVADHQRRGYASEAVRGFVRRAFERAEVSRVTAQTLPELLPSIGVLMKCGFRHAGAGAEPGAIRFELDRTKPSKEEA